MVSSELSERWLWPILVVVHLEEVDVGLGGVVEVPLAVGGVRCDAHAPCSPPSSSSVHADADAAFADLLQLRGRQASRLLQLQLVPAAHAVETTGVGAR